MLNTDRPSHRDPNHAAPTWSIPLTLPSLIDFDFIRIRYQCSYKLFFTESELTPFDPASESNDIRHRPRRPWLHRTGTHLADYWIMHRLGLTHYRPLLLNLETCVSKRMDVLISKLINLVIYIVSRLAVSSNWVKIQVYKIALSANIESQKFSSCDSLITFQIWVFMIFISAT